MRMTNVNDFLMLPYVSNGLLILINETKFPIVTGYTAGKLILRYAIMGIVLPD